ncbi:MAG: hypothetical protein GX567_14045 [Clostridia bacterium]|nr:hypothetical protein [Clostridia bacterium]
MIIQTVFLTSIAVILIFLCAVIGNLFINLIARDKILTPKDIFFSTYWGIILIVSSVAIYATNISTVFIVIIIPTAFLSLYHIPSIKSISAKSWYKNICITIPIFLIFSLVSQLLPYSWSIENDINFYSQVSQSLINSGIENTFHYFNEYIDDSVGNNAYHYFELWFNGIISLPLERYFSNLLLLKHFTYPFFITLIAIGLFSIITNLALSSQNLFSLLLIVSLLFVNLSSLINFENTAWDILHSVFDRPNFIFYFYGLIPATYVFMQGENYSAFFGYIVILPILSITTAPSIFLSAILFAFYLRTNKLLMPKQFLKIVGVISAVAGSIVCFYGITGSSVDSQLSQGASMSNLLHTAIQLWKAIIQQIVILSFKSLVLLIIPLGIGVFLIKNNYPNFIHLAVFALLTNFSGILVFQVLPTTTNTYQFAYMGYVTIFLVLILSILLVSSFFSIRQNILLLTTILTLAIIFNANNFRLPEWSKSIEDNFISLRGYESNTIQEIKSELTYHKEKHPKKIGFLIVKERTISPNHKHSLTYQYGNEILIYMNNMHFLPLTPPELLYQDSNQTSKYERAKGFNDKLTFYKHFDSTNSTGYINQFIKDENILFIITDSVLPYLDQKLITIASDE